MDEEIERQLTILYLFGNYLEITEKIILEEVFFIKISKIT